MTNDTKLPRTHRDSLIQAGWLTLLAAVGRVLMIPYTTYLTSQFPGAQPVNVSNQLISVVPDVLLSYILIRVSLHAASRLELGWPPNYRWGTETEAPKGRRAAIVTAVLLGAAVGLVLGICGMLIGDRWSTRPLQLPPAWPSVLGSLGAGIYEEIWFRLGAMTLVAWAITRLTANRLPAPRVVWTANIVAALLFGAAHLPLARATATLTPSLIAVVLVANAVVGIACGWLYWRRGLAAAMIAHATFDLVTKVAMPFVYRVM